MLLAVLHQGSASASDRSLALSVRTNSYYNWAVLRMGQLRVDFGLNWVLTSAIIERKIKGLSMGKGQIWIEIGEHQWSLTDVMGWN